MCSTLYNDKGYGDRSLIFFSHDEGIPVYMGRIDNVADDLITNISKLGANKLIVIGLPSHMRVIEFVDQPVAQAWI